MTTTARLADAPPATSDSGARQTTPATPPQAALPGAPTTARTLSSSELMRGQHTLAIAHNGSIYRLQTTRQGKLILTK